MTIGMDKKTGEPIRIYSNNAPTKDYYLVTFLNSHLSITLHKNEIEWIT